jgi:hypothetical protein
MTIEQLKKMGFREHVTAQGRRRFEYWRVTATRKLEWGGTVPVCGWVLDPMVKYDCEFGCSEYDYATGRYWV